MTKISLYLKKHKLTQAQFAKKIGASQCAVSMWASGVKKVGGHMARHIEKETQGEINRAEIRPDLFAA